MYLVVTMVLVNTCFSQTMYLVNRKLILDHVYYYRPCIWSWPWFWLITIIFRPCIWSWPWFWSIAVFIDHVFGQVVVYISWIWSNDFNYRPWI